MTLPLKKLYIDSKFKTKDSISNSNFKIELPVTVYMPQSTFFTIDDICIPHSWYSIEKDINDKLYVHILTVGLGGYSFYVTLPAGNYTGDLLKIRLQERLDAYGDDNISMNGKFKVSYEPKTHSITITITSNESFKILTDDELSTALDGYYTATYDRLNPASLNDVIKNFEAKTNSSSNPFESGFIDLQSINNIYISSPNLGSFTTLGSRGEQNIIKKVPVSSDFGYMIIDRVTSNHDYLECSKVTLKTVEFHLKDSHGRYIPLHNANVSFSIIFSIWNGD